MNGNRLLKRLIYPAVALLVIAGCSKAGTGGQAGSTEPASQTKPTDKPASSEPVTLLVYLQAAVSEEDFQMLFVDPVKKKYPNITLKAVQPSDGTRLDDLIAAGNVPDLLTVPDADLLGLSRQDLLFDIGPMAKQNNIDVSRFQKAAIDAVSTDKGELWALPYGMEFNALFYNKDIFDKFGVSYPKDGMTWQDAIDLAKRVTRSDNDILYRGLDVIGSNLMSFPFALSFIDGKTNKASMNNDKWKTVFELTKQIETIPGNEPPTPEGSTSKEAGSFIKDKNIAMLVASNPMKYFGSDMSWTNWDIAQYPSYKEIPNISGKVDSHDLAIAKTTKHKDEAMKVLQVLTSDEVQLISVRKTARVSPLINVEMQKQFGADLPYLKGKNIQAIFKSKVVAPPVYSPYESDAHKFGKQAFLDYVAGKVDVTTALRQADDQINKMLAGK